MALKEQEKAELIDSYRNLSNEADKMDSNLQHLQDRSSSAKAELCTLIQVCRSCDHNMDGAGEGRGGKGTIQRLNITYHQRFF